MRSATFWAVFMSCVTTMLVTGLLLARADDQLVDDVAHDRVEAGGRLVVEQHLGVHGQRPGQADALPHAAGELGRPLVRARSSAGRPRPGARRRSGRSSSDRMRRFSRSGKATFSATVMLSNRAAFWNKKPKRPRSAVSSLSPSSSIRWPSKTTWPLVGRSRPMIVLSSTVLPQPLSPMTASVWPRGTDERDVAQHRLAAELDAQVVQLDQAASRFLRLRCVSVWSRRRPSHHLAAK